MSDFSKYSAESEHYDDSKALVVGKKKDEIKAKNVPSSSEQF